MPSTSPSSKGGQFCTFSANVFPVTSKEMYQVSLGLLDMESSSENFQLMQKHIQTISNYIPVKQSPSRKPSSKI